MIAPSEAAIGLLEVLSIGPEVLSTLEGLIKINSPVNEMAEVGISARKRSRIVPGSAQVSREATGSKMARL